MATGTEVKVTDNRLRRLIRWARGGMRGLVLEDDAAVVAVALEAMLQRRREAGSQ